MSAIRIDGKGVASRILATLSGHVDLLESRHNVSPGLAIVVVSADPVQSSWADLKLRSAARAGVCAELIAMPADTTQVSLVTRIRELNDDDRFHGIFVQLPLPNRVSENDIRCCIAIEKDVDCMHPTNVARLMKGSSGGFSPASILAAHEALRSVPVDLGAKRILVCGRSRDADLLAAYFRRETRGGSTVTQSSPERSDFRSKIRSADVVIAAIGEPLFIKANMIKQDAVVIDTGQNRFANGNRKSGHRVVGDVDYVDVLERAAAITPVPGGLGPITVAMLLANTIEAARLESRSSWD